MAAKKKPTPVKRTVKKPAVAPPPVEDDSFGLPDIDYQPLDRNQPEEQPEPASAIEEVPVESITTETTEVPVVEPLALHHKEEEKELAEPTPEYVAPERRRSSVLPTVLVLFLVVLLAMAAGWYFVVYKPAKDREAKELAEKSRKEEEAKERDRLLAEQKRLEDERRRQEEAAANAKPEKGSITTLSERTKRYYVVAASSIDADLVMDYAKKLSDKGVNCKIIPPYGKIKFSRLTIAEGETFDEAQKLADNLKTEHGDKLWVIKY
ncbi:MAG: SPOR domain-containing protein [Cyclobacteriaceae bacterium]|jgi:hypothetical protein|nr:SPOR domain-containing protein [Cytophagales bacterium]MCZ8326955.1 SPOR domain-containing protein [Cyclobacteriaceae bacterium]